MLHTLPDQFITTRVSGKDKIPVDPKTGRACDPHDPAMWMSYEAACRLSPTVGFVLTRNDPYVFLDFDNCLDERGQWTAEATAAFSPYRERGAACEVSISGTGLHVLARADQMLMEGLRSKRDGWLERYHWGRFIQLGGTGQGAWEGSFDVDVTDLVTATWPRREALDEDGIPEEGPVEEWVGPTDDDTLIQIALKSRPSAAASFGAKASFKALWTGDREALAKFYPSSDPNKPWDASSAEAALAAHLAYWTGRDLARVQRLIERSQVRHDPDQKKYQRMSYLMPTIRDAARMVENVYKNENFGPGGALEDGGSLPSEVLSGMPGERSADLGVGDYMTVTDQMRHFEGCVYVETHHKIMLPDGRLLDQPRFRVAKGGHEFQMTADGSNPTKDAFEAFTQSRVHRFPRAVGVRHDPDAPHGDIDRLGRVNAFKLPDVPMSDGDVTPFLVHLSKLLPVERDRRILLSWMACMVQNRGRKFQWHVVIQGAEGNGKTFILECLTRAVGETVTHWPNPEDMQEKYNTYLEGNLLIGVEEIHMRGRRDLLDRLKKYLTGRRVEIRGMGVDKYMADNLTNWMFLTNFKDAVYTHQGDRRYAIFFTAQQEPGDLARDGMAGQSYFPGLWDWGRNGGFAAVAGYLNTYQIDPEFDPLTGGHRAPETSSRNEAIRASFGPVEEALLDAIAEERVGFRGGWVSTYYARKIVEENYRRVGPKIIGEALNNIGLVNFGRATRKIWNEGNGKPTLYFDANIVENPIFSDYFEKQGYIDEVGAEKAERGRIDSGPNKLH